MARSSYFLQLGLKRLLFGACFVASQHFAPAAQPSPSIQWMAWGDAAWQEAKLQHKPLFVHVTIAGSERAADMQRIAFAQASVVESLAQKFVCVQVDGDQYPGVLAAMSTFVSDTQQERGIPLNVWLSDTGAPLLGRTYLEPNDEWGKLGLINLIERVSSRQATDAPGLRAEAASLLENHFGRFPSGTADQAAATRDAISFLATSLNQVGAEASVVTRVTPRAWHLVVQQAASGQVESGQVRDLLLRLSTGPLRDAVSGAFFSRAATPEGDWPVLELDTALQIGLAETYLAAARRWPTDGFATVADELLDGLAVSVASPGGLSTRYTAPLTSPSDAPFLWSMTEIKGAMPADAPAIDDWQGLIDRGKVPESMDPHHVWAGRFLLNSSAMETVSVWPAVRASLRGIQLERLNKLNLRPAPLGTQALAAVVLAEGARQLKKPEYLTTARRLVKSWAQPPSGNIAGQWWRLAPDVPVTAQDLVAVMLALVEVEPTAGGAEAGATALARLHLEMQSRFVVDGVYGFPAGTALPYHDVPDLREDGIRATSTALAVRLHHASSGRFGLNPDDVWRRVGRAVVAMPDDYPELLRQLARR